MYTFSHITGLNTPEGVYNYLNKQNKENPTNLEEQAISLVGEKVYKTLIKGYTEKMWGKDCKELSKDIIKRLPIRYSFDNNYFDDKHQGVPVNGYTNLIEDMIGKNKSNNIELLLNTDFLFNKEDWLNVADNIIYCGAVDELLGYELGKLQWRGLRWENKVYTYNGHNGQGCALMNYTDRNVPYTRSIDHIQIAENKRYGNTILTYEYPAGSSEKYEKCYPAGSDSLYFNYVNLLSEKYPQIILGGRIGLYKYLDMDDTVKAAINYCKGLKKEKTVTKKNDFFNIWVIGTKEGSVGKLPNIYYREFITCSIPEKENINPLNRFLSEFVCMWYVWKNGLYSKYVGFCHYNRIIQYDTIMMDKLDMSIQYYHIHTKKIEFSKTVDYPFIERYSPIYPRMVTEDEVEYLHKQTVISQEKLYEYCDKGIFYNREIFTCRWEVFCELMRFVNGYVDFISNKYNLKNYSDWKNHISKNIIPFYREKGMEFVMNKQDYNPMILWQKRIEYLRIFSQDEGVGRKCNCWRVYSYIIEELVSIFIGTHNNIAKILRN